MTKRHTVTLTAREVEAFWIAWALYETEYESEEHPPVDYRANLRALERINAKLRG